MASEQIVDGPSLWGLIIDGLARNGTKESAVRFRKSDGKSKRWGSEPVVITGLRSVWNEPYQPADRFSSREMERALGASYDWENAWWFEGHSPGMPSIMVWGFYNPVSRKGILQSQYTGGMVANPVVKAEV